MRLAEALAARADLQRRIEQLRARIVANARYQEGEEPAEDATALIAEADAALTRLQSLIRRISELRQVSALPVAALRARADAVAQELRELDNRIQQANWSHDLEEESGSR